MTNQADAEFAIETMRQKLIGATITRIIKSGDGEDMRYGFEAMQGDKMIRCWMLSDAEDNGAGFLDVCI